MMEIRRRLIEAHAPQKGSTRLRKIDWAVTSIQSILQAADAYYRGLRNKVEMEKYSRFLHHQLLIPNI